MGVAAIRTVIEKKPRYASPGQIAGRIEFLLLQQEHRQHARPGVGGEHLAGGLIRIFKDDAGRREPGSKMCCESSPVAFAKNNKIAGRNMAGIGEIGPGCNRVVCSKSFGWVLSCAQTEAAVIDSEDIDAQRMQSSQCRN